MKQAEIDAWNWARERNFNRAREEWNAGRTNRALELFSASSASPIFFRIMIDHLTEGLRILDQNEWFLFEELAMMGRYDSLEKNLGLRDRFANLQGTLEEITGLPKGEMTGRTVSLATRNTYQYLIDQLSILAAKALT